MTALTISRLAQAGGVGVETVRFYQRKGLLAAPPRGPRSGVHLYDQTDLKKLRFIRAAQAAGFTLAEIAELLHLDASEDRETVRELAMGRIEALDRQIAMLNAVRRSLINLTRDCAANKAGPCPIITAFEIDEKPGG